MKQPIDRRKFLTTTTGTLALAGGAGLVSSCKKEAENGNEPGRESDFPFSISLAEWSFHRALKAGSLDHLDFPRQANENFGIHAVEWVNQFFHTDGVKQRIQPKGKEYLAQMKQRCEDNGVQSVLIMCDRVGNLGDPDAARRTSAVTGHHAWCDAAKFLGCHSIRVNAASDARLSPEEQADLCADGLGRLCDFAGDMGLNVIVENHGGLSSNGAWLAGVMKLVNKKNCGTLPDFGNFYVVKRRGSDAATWERQKAPYSGDPAYKEDEVGLGYDRYKGTAELMPYAKGVSAKTHDFNQAGEEIHTDYLKMFRIVKDSGYRGHVGIEYEGDKLSEPEGIKKTKALLEKVFAVL